MLKLTPLWTSEDICTLTGGRSGASFNIEGVQIDSRDICKGDLFVALKGTSSDGHDHVMAAFKSGATAAMVSHPPLGLDALDARLIYVADTYDALTKIAKQSMDRSEAIKIGVTGSAGKTSVVQALKKALSYEGRAHASIRSFNNHVGLPLSMARMVSTSKFGVFELGMSAPGEISTLSNLLCPEVSVITSIGAAHLQAFDAIEGIASEKASIVKGMAKGSTLIIGCSHPYVALIEEAAYKAGVKVIKASLIEGEGDIYPVRMVQHADCTCMTVHVADQLLTFKINQPGDEWAMNALLILAATSAAGGDVVQASLALASLQVEDGRGRLLDLDMGDGNLALLDDSYNANPLSMRSSFKRFSLLPYDKSHRRIAVLGDMAELGDTALTEHLDLKKYVKAAGFDLLVTVGPKMEALAEVSGIKSVSFHDVKEAKKYLENIIRPNDQLMIKGSNSIGLNAVVSHLSEVCETEKARVLGYGFTDTLSDQMAAE